MSDIEEDRSQSFGTLGNNPLEAKDGSDEQNMEGKPGKAKSGVKRPEPVQNVKVSRDRTNEQVLQFNADPGMVLQWDPEDFRELPPEVERQLTFDNLKNYLKAQYVAKEKATAAAATRVEVANPLNPLGMNSEFRLRIRERRGWHQCWKTPGMELDAALAGPYRQVRKQALAKDKEGKQLYDKHHQMLYEDKEPGYENGDVLKLQDENGKTELVAVECPAEMFEKYLEYMAEKSRLMYGANKNRFVENVEEMNRHLDSDKRIGVMDGEQKVN